MIDSLYPHTDTCGGGAALSPPGVTKIKPLVNIWEAKHHARVELVKLENLAQGECHNYVKFNNEKGVFDM